MNRDRDGEREIEREGRVRRRRFVRFALRVKDSRWMETLKRRSLMLLRLLSRRRQSADADRNYDDYDDDDGFDRILSRRCRSRRRYRICL